jgi:hypothetical protein
MQGFQRPLHSLREQGFPNEFKQSDEGGIQFFCLYFSYWPSNLMLQRVAEYWEPTKFIIY